MQVLAQLQHSITSWTNQYGATQKILALCSALCDYFRVRGLGSSSFPSADTFLHSPPMAESCAAPKAALFLRAHVPIPSGGGPYVNALLRLTL